MAAAKPSQLSLIEVTSLGVGTMIGAGIFALFGEISTLAGGYAWAAFLAAGVISGLAGYSYFSLSKISKTNGGIAEYLTRGWNGGLTGSVISLCYFLSIAIVLGLVAKSFAHYSVQVFGLSNAMTDPLAIAIMVVFLLVNAAGIKFMGISEKILVIAKLVVLVGFTVIAFTHFNASVYSGNQGTVAFDFGKFVNAVALANLSFAGFAVIANAGGSVRAGADTIGRAIFIAIAVVALVYVSLDIAVFGSISLDTIETAKNYALAEAARPVLGQAGFVVLGLTAIISTMTNINANTFSAANTISYMGSAGQLSPKLSKRLFLRQGNIAMILTVVIVMAMILTLDLGQIGDVASLTFLLVHSFIPLGNVLNQRQRTGANPVLLWLAVIGNGGLGLFFIYHLFGGHDLELLVFAGVVLFALVFEVINTRIFGSKAA
ncbi:APC family permease [Thioclava sp. 15-R06ZXC-3]|uniref:APC family permease n=1 Tax=Thioclava arctica TaxID=3238301 RepID=A0ABV3TJN8_9RHOB